ncbi:MAG: hypothetical protein M1391_05585 [Bacteroidetes bacterium]|nr:hypothetical protein [Bacteroidota bacterium]
MRVISNKIEGPFIIDEDTKILGMVEGPVTVIQGKILHLNGVINGSLTLEKNSTVHLHGTVMHTQNQDTFYVKSVETF